MILVFNASPVIVLAKTGLLEAIVPLGETVKVPQAVVDEILRADDASDPATLWFKQSGAPFQRVSNPAIPAFLAAWDIGAGETAVIAVASSTPGAVAVLDDLAARRCAQAHGIPVIGTMGLLLLAKKREVLPSVTQAIRSVITAGLYVSEAIAAEVRAQAGE